MPRRPAVQVAVADFEKAYGRVFSVYFLALLYVVVTSISPRPFGAAYRNMD
jgi:hypothetical protein